jgi:large subunit ribosomal protein L25
LPIKLSAAEARKVLGETIPEVGITVRLKVHLGDEVLEFETVLQEIQWDYMQLTLRHLDFFVPAEKEAQTAELAPAA